MSERYYLDAACCEAFVLPRYAQIIERVVLDDERVELVVRHGYSGQSRCVVYLPAVPLDVRLLRALDGETRSAGELAQLVDAEPVAVRAALRGLRRQELVRGYPGERYRRSETPDLA